MKDKIEKKFKMSNWKDISLAKTVTIRRKKCDKK